MGLVDWLALRLIKIRWGVDSDEADEILQAPTAGEGWRQEAREIINHIDRRRAESREG